MLFWFLSSRGYTSLIYCQFVSPLGQQTLQHGQNRQEGPEKSAAKIKNTALNETSFSKKWNQCHQKITDYHIQVLEVEKKKKSPLFSCSDIPKYHRLLVLFSVYFQRIHHLYFFQGTSLHNSEVKEDMELNFKSETYYGEIREEM